MADDFKWMRESLTESQMTRSEKIADLILPDIDKGLNRMTRIFLAMDEALVRIAPKSRISMPRWAPDYPLGEHGIGINRNLFIFYPYRFNAEQFTEVAQKAKQAGFNVRVDSHASRLPGGNVRVIFWKPRKKSAKNKKSKP